MAREDDIDERIVEKVGEKKAVPLLPEEEEGKELVIHVPEETAKSTEIGVLSTLVILILIASAIAVAYFIYDRKRQQKIKECVDKLKKTEEGKKLTGEHSDIRNEPLPPDPFPMSDETSSITPTILLPEDDTTATVTSEEPPFSDEITEVTTEVEPTTDDANNNRDRNTNAFRKQQRRRCCMCLCCPPLQPSLEEIWKKKKSQQKSSSHDLSAKHSLRVMEEGMKGHARFHPKTSTSDNTRATPNKPRRHRRSHRRSQSQPTTSRLLSSSRRLSWDRNRSCWTQAALLKRSQSVSPGRSRRARANERRHRHGVAHRSRREDLDRKARRYAEEQSRKNPSGRNASRHPIDTSVGDHQRSESRTGDGKGRRGESRSRHGFYPHGEGFRYYVKSHQDSGERDDRMHRDPSRSRGSIHDDEDDEFHNQSHRHRSHSRDVNHQAKGQSHYSRERGHPETHRAGKPRHQETDPKRRDSQDHHDKHRCIHGKIPAHYRKSQTRDRQSSSHSRRVDSIQSQNQKYCDSEQSQEQLGENRGQSDRVQRQDSISKRHKQDLASPSQSYDSQRNMTDSVLLLCNEGSEQCNQNAFVKNRHPCRRHKHQVRTENGGNQNQSGFRTSRQNQNQSTKPDSRSTPRFPPPRYPYPAKTGYILTRTIPNTDSQESSLCGDYNHYPARYSNRYGHLNVSQNYNCEEHDLTPSQVDNSAACTSAREKHTEDVSGDQNDELSAREKHTEDVSGDQNDELSDNEPRSGKRKVCLKRSARPRFRKALLARLKSFPRAVTGKSEKGPECHEDPQEQGRSTSTDSSQDKEDMATLAQRLFGLKLSSAKRPKRHHNRPSKKKKRPRTEDSHPLLGDNTSWDSEDTTYEASKGTEPVDSGYVFSTSFPSEPNRSDLTLTPLSPLTQRKTFSEDTAKILSLRQDGFQSKDKHSRGSTNNEPSSTHFGGERHEFANSCLLRDFHNSVFETKSNNNSILVSSTDIKSQDTERVVAFKALGAKSVTDMDLACLDSVSKEGHREFRKLATEKWCEQQMCSSAEKPPQINFHNMSARDKDNEYREESSAVQSLVRNSPVLLDPERQSEFFNQSKYTEAHVSTSYLPHEHPNTFACSTTGQPFFQRHDRSTEKAESHITMEMDHLDFSSPIFSTNTMACSSQPNHNNASTLESSDLFEKLARDRLHCLKHTRHFLHGYCAGGNPEPDIVTHARGSQNPVCPRIEGKNTENRGSHSDTAALCSCSPHCVDSQAPASQCWAKGQSMSGTQPSVDRAPDRGHLSASILPPQSFTT